MNRKSLLVFVAASLVSTLPALAQNMPRCVPVAAQLSTNSVSRGMELGPFVGTLNAAATVQYGPRPEATPLQRGVLVELSTANGALQLKGRSLDTPSLDRLGPIGRTMSVVVVAAKGKLAGTTGELLIKGTWDQRSGIGSYEATGRLCIPTRQ